MTVTPYSNHGFVELHVPDLKAVKDFYLKLGFEAVWEIDTYLVMKFDHTVLTFNYGQFEMPLGRGVEIVVQSEKQNIKDLYEQFVTQNIAISEPLKLQDWNKWDFRLYDLNGYYLRFTEPENVLYQ